MSIVVVSSALSYAIQSAPPCPEYPSYAIPFNVAFSFKVLYLKGLLPSVSEFPELDDLSCPEGITEPGNHDIFGFLPLSRLNHRVFRSVMLVSPQAGVPIRMFRCFV